jgi:tRNA A37 threonylcarbamoyladenosine synthetase subunit TsaC/SUA5/YrdC
VLTLKLVVINAAGGARIVSECVAHSEADNDVVDDVELIADEECAGNVNSTILDNFQSILPDITC